MLTLVPVLTRFLEAATTAEKWRSIAPIEKQLEKDMRQAFTIQGKKFLDGFAANRGKFEEALSPEDWVGIWDEVAQQTLQFFIDPIQAAVQLSMTSAAEELVGELEVDYSFSLKNPRAVQYVEDHGAELVKGINDTTRDYLRTVIRQGTDEGWSYDQMAKAITRRFADFAVGRPQEHIDSRAHLVAVTEVGNAYEHGNMIVAQDLKAAGLKMEKKWSTMGDARVDPHCTANERQGWIPVDDAFSDGSMQPLSHPACRCTALYRRMQDAEIPYSLQPKPPIQYGKLPVVSGEAHPEVLKAFQDEFELVSRDYPFLRDYVKGFDFTEETGVAARWNTDEGTISLPHKQAILSKAELNNLRAGVHVIGGGRINVTVVHEIGHAVDSYVKFGIGRGSDLQDEFFDEIRALAKALPQPSQYGPASNLPEWVAEQFAKERTEGGDDLQRIFRKYIPMVKEENLESDFAKAQRKKKRS